MVSLDRRDFMGVMQRLKHWAGKLISYFPFALVPEVWMRRRIARETACRLTPWLEERFRVLESRLERLPGEAAGAAVQGLMPLLDERFRVVEARFERIPVESARAATGRLLPVWDERFQGVETGIDRLRVDLRGLSTRVEREVNQGREADDRLYGLASRIHGELGTAQTALKRLEAREVAVVAAIPAAPVAVKADEEGAAARFSALSIRLDALAEEVGDLRRSIGRTVTDAVTAARSDGARADFKALGLKLDSQRLDLDALCRFFVLKEIDEQAIKTIVRPPVLRLDVRDDLYTLFSHNVPCARRIRAWFVETVNAISENAYKSLSQDGRTAICRANLSLARGTAKEVYAYCRWLQSMSVNQTCRSDPEELLPHYQYLHELPKNSIWVPEEKTTWLRYVAILMECGKTGEAEELLRKVYDAWGKANMALFLPVAQLARQCGIADDMTRRSAEIWELVTAQRETFEELFGGGSVAVVGNGPQEMGTGNGKLIDAHDTVIRMNHRPESEAYIRDYGQKTTLVGGHLFRLPNELLADPQVRAVFHIYPMYRTSTKESDLAVAEKVLRAGKLLFYNDHALGKRLRGIFRSMPDDPRYQFSGPSTGFLLASIIKAVNPEVSWGDLYGFSAKEDSFPEEYDRWAGLERNDKPYLHFTGKEHRDGNRFNFNHLGREGMFLRRLYGVDGD